MRGLFLIMAFTRPEPGIFDDPNVTVSINSQWLSYIDGAIGKLLRDGVWLGDDDEVAAAHEEISKLLIQFGAVGAGEVFTIFGDDDAAYADAIDDSTPVNLGMRIQSSVAGNVTGIRIWRRDGDGTGQIGYLYTNGGSLLASATFPADGLGWIVAEFDEPVAIDADTTYVIASYSPGHFVRTFGTLSSPISNPPLTAIADGVDGYSGTYVYGSAGTFPTNNGFAQNYWLDLTFTE